MENIFEVLLNITAIKNQVKIIFMINKLFKF
jgi:hypothetical protein